MDLWSDFIGWITGEAEKPAEPLVLGAELKCPWGTAHSYLYVDSDDIDINNLPQAHVEDCMANYNIYPFGKCIYRMGQPCELFFLFGRPLGKFRTAECDCEWKGDYHYKIYTHMSNKWHRNKSSDNRAGCIICKRIDVI